MGLYNEIVSFFSTMNMYSSAKLQVSDTKEYQDFLQMYTGKTKTRETSEEYFYIYVVEKTLLIFDIKNLLES